MGVSGAQAVKVLSEVQNEVQAAPVQSRPLSLNSTAKAAMSWQGVKL
ncbi:hypothetical protein NKDENANG_00862 [Candidatus Entotheonellaceae bacterium PAL068K]